MGAGGLGQEVLWAASNMNASKPSYVFRGFCDDASARQDGLYCGQRLLGTPERAAAALGGDIFYVCAVGDNVVRERLVGRMERLGWKAETVIDPSVLVAPGVVVGVGSYVGALSILSPAARLGRHIMVNHGCSIGHDSQLGDFAQVCPGGRVSGGAVLGCGAFVGSNAVVAPGIRIGDWACLGAAGFALRAIPDGCTAVGNPARVVFISNAPKSAILP